MVDPSSRSVELADAVRARRLVLGLRQEDLADLAGTSERFVTALESGKETVQLDKVLDVLATVGYDIVLEPGSGRLWSREADESGGRRRAPRRRR